MDSDKKNHCLFYKQNSYNMVREQATFSNLKTKQHPQIICIIHDYKGLQKLEIIIV